MSEDSLSLNFDGRDAVFFYGSNQRCRPSSKLNFYLSVLLSVAGGIAVLFKTTLAFPEMLLLHGPLARNLLLIVFIYFTYACLHFREWEEGSSYEEV